MKNQTKLKIYQDSKEIPFWNYKRIDQTGDYLFMIKGYESGDEVPDVDVEDLKNKFSLIEQDYAVSINMKNEEVVQYGQIAISQNEMNRYLLVIKMIDLLIKTNNIRVSMDMEPSEDFNEEIIRDLLKDFKIQKCDSIVDQRQKLIERVEKHKNQIAKLQSALKKQDQNTNTEEFNLTDQFVCLQIGLEMPLDDKQISLYEFGLYVRRLVEKVEASNKILKNG
ncbi:hypothetical protein [Chryseobacterium vrystaatense]|uniref:Uncharacterized protein n=1 Tax=Chryseobacterium vrystaatense TaxID=307480 RepID=A0A1M4ZMG5_9FLAO|nr:hypothetical protein [Chryseobacterium vrystaatense]SHF18756.1 hypothetical protein SAMN02787073_1632 [Chryseobacterium vrystaatense]